MNTFANIIWIVLGGFWISLVWLMFGVCWCLTIVGIPIGLQCFKFAAFSLAPFGKNIRVSGGTASLFFNILWILFGGIEISLTCIIFGLMFCCTIVGIPFGLQCFKLAKLALLPFGAEIIYGN